VNILFVSSQFPNASEPNKGIFTLQIVRELAALADIRVIAPVPSLGPFTCIDAFKRYRTRHVIPYKEEIDNITVYHPRYFAMPGMGFTHHTTMYKVLNSLIRNIHEEWPIEAVNCHWIFPDGVAVQRICEDLRIPIVLTPLGTDLNRYSEHRLRKSVIRRSLVNSDKVSVLSSPMYKRCLALGVDQRKLSIIPNGVDVQKFSILDRSYCRNELKIPVSTQVILFVGSLVPVKGIEFLLKAFAALRKGREEGSVKLYIIGSGFQEKDLKLRAHELKINADTVFVGAVAHDRLPLWMNSADCFCLPSLSEGHPNVVMEALACGVPVVASAVGSVPDYVTMQTGQLITPSDPVELSEKLDKCLSISYERKKIRATVEEMSWKNCAGKYYETLKALIA
jgi:teichuronic acid biosynthesis glycosyltransferase TuaC